MRRPLRQQAGNEAAMLSALGYTQVWFDYGLLTPELLATQHNIFLTSDDQHTEHHRYGAFRHYLDGRTHLTDEELTGYLHVAIAEQDSLMGSAAAKDLFTEVNLTDAQFAEVCEKLDAFPGEWVAALRSRQQLLRRLAAGRLDTTLFNECLATGDGVAQKTLLEVAGPAQLAELAINGKTRSIRNRATEKLKSRLR